MARLLDALAGAPEHTLVEERIRFRVWREKPTTDGAVKVLICRTRVAFRRVGADNPICNMWGEGYMLRVRVERRVNHEFTTAQWAAIQECVRVANRHYPGILERTGL